MTRDARPSGLVVPALLAVAVLTGLFLVRPWEDPPSPSDAPAPGGPPVGAAPMSSPSASAGLPPSPSAIASPGPSAIPSPSTADLCPWGGRLSVPDRTVKVHHPVSGYFMFTDPNRCATRAKVEGAHRIGADTIVTFGAILQQGSLDVLRTGEPENPFAQFRVAGTDGYEHALRQTGGGSIRTIYTYANKTVFSDAAQFCEGRDGQETTPYGVFTWWLFPVEGGYSDCESPSRTYDLVVSYSATATDADTVLLSDAERYGMSVYLGMPRPRSDPGLGYVADTSYTQTLGAFTTRVLTDWNQKFGRLDAFAGAYQTLETAVFTDAATWEPNLRVYELQNRIVGFRLPRDRQQVIVSPYADLRRGELPVSAIQPTFRRIAETAAGVRLILAPQDGAGTGRVGLFRPEDADQPVRSDLHGVVGETTYGAAYAGTTATLYAEASAVPGVTLWANVEAFRPPGRVGDRAPGLIDVLDLQVELARPHVEKIIAYRWDGYLDTSGLAAEILTRGDP